MLTFRCHCGKQLQAREEYAGQVTACPTCGREMTIPGEAIQTVEPLAARPPAGPPPRRRPDDYGDEGRAYPVPSAAGTSGKATAAFVMALVSFCVPVLLSLLAVLFAILALVDISNSRGRLCGRGLAITGLILGLISLLVMPLLTLALVLPFTQRVREAAARQESLNNLKQIGLAFQNYYDTYRRFPPATVYSQDGRPLYSWRVLLLPFVEGDQIYNQFHFNEPWDSPHNMQFVKSMPRVYAHPLDPDGARQGKTHYQVFVAGTQEQPRPIFVNDPPNLEPFPVGPVPGATFQTRGAALGITQITDGTSNTILAAEAPDGVPWTSPNDLPYSSRGPLPRLGGVFSDGYCIGLADGSARFLVTNQVSDQTLRDAITANGGEVPGPDW